MALQIYSAALLVFTIGAVVKLSALADAAPRFQYT